MQVLTKQLIYNLKVQEPINLRHRELLSPTFLENDLESQFLAFTPNSSYQFTNGDIIVGSSTTARGTVSNYNDGTIFNFVISSAGTNMVETSLLQFLHLMTQ